MEKSTLKGLGISATTVLIASFVLVFSTILNACIDPTSQNAFEVVLNKPGISYNLNVLEELANNGYLVKIDEFTYVSKSQIEPVVEMRDEKANTSSDYPRLDFLVVIYIEEFSSGAPYVEGVSDPGRIEYYLGLRLESLTPVEEIPEEVLKPVVLDLISQLITLQIVGGVEWSDIELIANTARFGYAGWNNRLVYSAELEKWAPYSELVNKGLMNGVLYRGNACAFQLPQDVLARVREVPPLGHIVTTMIVPVSETGDNAFNASPVHSQPKIAENGQLVAMALLAGVIAGLVVYIYISRKL